MISLEQRLRETVDAFLAKTMHVLEPTRVLHGDDVSVIYYFPKGSRLVMRERHGSVVFDEGENGVIDIVGTPRFKSIPVVFGVDHEDQWEQFVRLIRSYLGIHDTPAEDGQ